MRGPMFRIPNLGVKGRLKKYIIPEGKKLLRGISGSGIRPFGFFMEVSCWNVTKGVKSLIHARFRNGKMYSQSIFFKY
jgi:hypothetical protein